MDPSRCQYKSKPCRNPRSLKDDGTPHRLCDHHRDNARNAQRRWHARRRHQAGKRPADDLGELTGMAYPASKWPRSVALTSFDHLRSEPTGSLVELMRLESLSAVHDAYDLWNVYVPRPEPVPFVDLAVDGDEHFASIDDFITHLDAYLLAEPKLTPEAYSWDPVEKAALLYV